MTERSKALLAAIAAKREAEQSRKAEAKSALAETRQRPAAKSVAALEQRVAALEAIIEKMLDA